MEKKVYIHKKKQASILRKHPWIFSGAISNEISNYEDGDIVSVYAESGKFLARGIFQHATIAVRILSFEDIQIDRSFLNDRICSAFELRKSLGLLSAKNNIFRLIHGEGDGLPGLIVDYYNGAAIIQCHSLGMLKLVDQIADGIKTALGDHVQAIYNKSKETLPNRADVEDSYLFGQCETPHRALENEIEYSIDWINGQKTGFFIDQRENRSLLARYSKDKRILNTFCYSGGFSLSSLKEGASFVCSLDSSKKAIALVEENIALNKFSDRHESVVADAMQYMKEVDGDYDIIVLDPPAFAKHRNKRHKAVQGYKRLNSHAIRQIRPGGIIFTFSCSQVVDKQLFTNTVIAASIEAGRKVRILEQLHQPADHPINAYHPEGEYLKGLVIHVE